MIRRSINLPRQETLVMKWKKSVKMRDLRLNKLKDNAWLTVRSKSSGDFRITKKKYWTDKLPKLKTKLTDSMSSKRSEKERWKMLLSAVEHFRLNVKNKKQLLRNKKKKTLRNSGGFVTRSCSWLSSKRRKKKDREQRNCLALLRHNQMQNRRRLSRTSWKNKKILSRPRHSSTSRRRISILMLKNASPNGKVKARTWNLSLWSLRITKSALSEKITDSIVATRKAS